MSVVYLLYHDDRHYDMGDSYVRGVFADQKSAQASLLTRTPSGAISRAYDRHDNTCCTVEEWDVLTEPNVDVRLGQLWPPNPSERLVPNSLIQQVIDNAMARSPFGSGKAVKK